jgi:hypothetical protein
MTETEAIILMNQSTILNALCHVVKNDSLITIMIEQSDKTIKYVESKFNDLGQSTEVKS